MLTEINRWGPLNDLRPTVRAGEALPDGLEVFLFVLWQSAESLQDDPDRLEEGAPAAAGFCEMAQDGEEVQQRQIGDELPVGLLMEKVLADQYPAVALDPRGPPFQVLGQDIDPAPPGVSAVLVIQDAELPEILCQASALLAAESLVVKLSGLVDERGEGFGDLVLEGIDADALAQRKALERLGEPRLVELEADLL